MILDDLDKFSQIKLVKLYLEKFPDFQLELSEEASNLLDSLGIKEEIIAWKQLWNKINDELHITDEDDELIEKFKLILEDITFLH